MGIFGKMSFGLKKSRDKMSGAIDEMLDAFDSLEDDLYTELEEILVMGDVGVSTAVAITEELKDRVRKNRISQPSQVKDEIKSIVADMLEGGEDMGLITVPSIVLVIGVNGVGKTTTIGKMAAMYKAQGKKVLLGAADTFRAAAIDQLDIWAQRADVDIIKHKEGADPAAVIFDTISAGKARNVDIIICDTAGRLHNKKNLMDELSKIYRVIDRELPYSDREVLLVLDATTGQNAVNQAKEFKAVADITGIVLTKLDGTARGGVVLAIKNDLKVPVKFVGVGEKIDDLQPFNPQVFAQALFDAAIPEGITEEDSDIYEEDVEQANKANVETIQDVVEEDRFEDARIQSQDEPLNAVNQEKSTESETTDNGRVLEHIEEQEKSVVESELDQEESVEESEMKQEDTEPKQKERKKRFGFFNRKS